MAAGRRAACRRAPWSSEIRRLVDQGVREVVLTGVDITAYGADLPGAPKLGRLVEQILTLVPGLARLRLSSLDVAECDERLIDLAAQRGAVDAASASVAAGRARHDLEAHEAAAHDGRRRWRFAMRLRARRPEIVFGADLIAGFPTETDAMFEATLDHVRACGLDLFACVSVFGARADASGAHAAIAGQHRQGARGAACARRGREALALHLASLKGREIELLVEQDLMARSPTYAPVKLSRAHASGTLVRRGGDRRGRALCLCRGRVMAEAEGKKPGFFARLKAGLARSTQTLTQGITRVFTRKTLDQAALDELEELLIGADMGAKVAADVVAEIKRTRFNSDVGEEEIRGVLAEEVAKILRRVAKPLTIRPDLKPHVILVAGVNGSGKTTTIGKLAQKYRGEGLKVMLAAGDTFRAAAVEQLKIWGERTGAPVIAKEIGADAAGLAFEAFERARKRGLRRVADRHGRAVAEQGRVDGGAREDGARVEEARPGCAAQRDPGARCDNGAKCRGAGRGVSRGGAKSRGS